jgi:nucleoside 2-deoxyribosyltransferase
LKIYLASRFSDKERMAEYAEILRQDGHIVTSRWLDETVKPDAHLDEITPEYAREVAYIDLEDIDYADTFVLFTVDPRTPTVRGGRHFESGYAFYRWKEALIDEFVVVGPRENIFHYLDGVVQLDSFEQLREFLAAKESRRKAVAA